VAIIAISGGTGVGAAIFKEAAASNKTAGYRTAIPLMPLPIPGVNMTSAENRVISKRKLHARSRFWTILPGIE
jgi:hypothetical protein